MIKAFIIRFIGVLFFFLVGIILLLMTVPISSAAVPLADGVEYAYAITGDGNIVVIDTATDVVADVIHVSDDWLWDVAVNPAGTYLFASVYEDEYIVVYDTATNTLVKTIPTTGYYPVSVALNHNGTCAYVWASKQSKNYVLTIDLKTFTLIKSVKVSDSWIGENTGMWGITEDDHYVVKAEAGTIIRYDTLTDAIATNSTYAALDPKGMTYQGEYFMIASFTDCKIYRYNPATNVFTSIWTYGEYPFSITWDLLGGNLYVGFWNETGSRTNVSKVRYFYSGSIAWNVTMSPASTWPTYLRAVQSGAKVYGGVDDSTGVAVLDVLSQNISKRVSTGGVKAGLITSSVISSTGSAMQFVTFTAKTAYNTIAVGGLNVTVYDSADRLLYSGLTDDTGACTFYLSALLEYRLLFNQTPNVNTWYNVTPAKTSYLVSIPFSDLTGLTSWSDTVLPNTGSSVVHYTIDHPFNSTTGAAWMNSSYTDDSGLSSTVGFFLYKNGSVVGDTKALVTSSLDSAAPFMCNFSIANAAGSSYQIEIWANQTSGAQYNYSYGLGYTFPGAKWLGGILPLNWYFWIAFGIVLIFFSVGTVSKKGLFGIFGAVAGFLFTIGGWFSLYLPDAAALSAVGVVFILSVLMFFVEREKYT